ncbi:MAG: hypothetical protein N2322_03700, partial [Terrimicrobiaceae bacterium]|nr:hypothetical protein [Terrimicrobiaceae bacterium]
AWEAGSASSMAWLGAACGVAVSAKYAGAIAWVLPLAAAWRCRRPTAALGAACAAGAVVALAINWPALAAWGDFSEGLSREAGYAMAGHKGLTRDVPHGVYGAVFREVTNPAVWVLLVVYAAGLVRAVARGCWRERGPELALAGFLTLYILVLSFSPKTHHRYFLPVTGVLLALAASGAGRLIAASGARRLAGAGLGLAALGWSAAGSADVLAAFSKDTRGELVEFIEANLPADALIIQDKRVGLTSRSSPRPDSSGREIAQAVEGKLFAADVASLETLRRRGAVYVAVSEGDFGRFFLQTHRPREQDRADYERRKAFYEELFREGELIWSRKAGRLPYLQPDIRLYRLPPSEDGQAP